MDFLRKLVMLVVGIWVLLLGSCAMMGLGTVVAVEAVAGKAEQLAGSEFAAKMEREHVEHARRERNDRLNREASYNDEYEDYRH